MALISSILAAITAPRSKRPPRVCLLPAYSCKSEWPHLLSWHQLAPHPAIVPATEQDAQVSRLCPAQKNQSQTSQRAAAKNPCHPKPSSPRATSANARGVNDC